MTMEVDVIVVSEAPKDLGPEVKVIVGLPSPNPWSLPFAHKAVFAQNVDRYDLFIYSEDDMYVTEENIQAFLRATPQLEPREIAGYLRYEIGQSGVWSLPETAHGRGIEHRLDSTADPARRFRPLAGTDVADTRPPTPRRLRNKSFVDRWNSDNSGQWTVRLG